MIVYETLGVFYEGMEWEDFYSSVRKFCSRRTKKFYSRGTKKGRTCRIAKWRYPRTTISVGKNESISKKDRFGWIDATVLVLDKENAKKVLAQINRCSPKEIEIIEKNISIAI